MEKDRIKPYLHPLKPEPTSLKPRGKLRQKVSCILFDVYGTLFISASGDISVSRKNSPARDRVGKLLEKYNIHRSAEDVVHDLHRRIKNRHTTLRSKGVDHPEVVIERVWQEVLNIEEQNRIREFAVEFEFITNPVGPMPRLAALLSACRQQKKIMGIISNAQFYTPLLFDWFLNADVQKLGFDQELLLYSFEHQVAKPSAILFETAADRLAGRGIDPLEVLYVGNDMLNDIYPAHAIGFQTALFAGDRRSLRLRENDPRCMNLEPDLVITDLGELIEHIQ